MSWPMVKLGDVCQITMGQAPSGSFYNEKGQGYALIAGAGDFGKLNPLPKKYTTKASKLSKSGDIIICIRATIGDLNWSDKEYCLGRGVAGLRGKESLYQGFLWHCLNYNKNVLSSKGTGSTFKQISRNHIEELIIPLPPIEEQKRIAAILDKADGLRQKREQAIKMADDFLRATFLEMFLQLDDCGNKVKLGDIVTLDAPMVDPREDKFIDLIHIGPDRIERNTGLLLPALTAREENLISKKFLFDENYVLYSKIRPYLKKCAIPDFGGLCSADMYPVKPISGKTNREFIWQLLLSDFFTKYTETLPDRANIPKLNRKELLSFELSLPPIPLQEKYKAIVQKTNHAKLIMRTQNGNSILNQLADELFLTY